MQRGTRKDVLRSGAWYFLGTLPPVFLLWFYQWKSFGHPLMPGQHWMPPVEWIELGYQGYGPSQLELLLALAFDHRYGLFVASPLMILAVVCVFHRNSRESLPGLELIAMLGFFVALWIFFSGNNYTRLQTNTGIRYMAPVLPFLFIPAALVLVRMPRLAIFAVSLVAVIESWCLAMHRELEHSLGVLNPIVCVFCEGFQLPFLRVLSRMEAFSQCFEHGESPFPIFAVVAVIVAAIWIVRRPPEMMPVSNRVA